MLKAEGAGSGPKRAEKQEAAMLLVSLAERSRSIVFRQAAGEVSGTSEIVVVRVILADKGDAYRFDDGGCIYAGGVRLNEPGSISRVEPLDSTAETSQLFLR